MTTWEGNVVKMGAAKFKAQCLALIDTLSSEGIIITKHGKPVAKLIPIQEQHRALIGALKNKIRVRGDIFKSGVQWNAES